VTGRRKALLLQFTIHDSRFTIHVFFLLSLNACRRRGVGEFRRAREEPKELAITPDFIETFRVVCPACRGRVVLKEDASGIKCTECRRVYPIRNDIPALIVEEATIEDEESPKRD
jgi:uncharacterized protein YbaR (Trm112 family)